MHSMFLARVRLAHRTAFTVVSETYKTRIRKYWHEPATILSNQY